MDEKVGFARACSLLAASLCAAGAGAQLPAASPPAASATPAASAAATVRVSGFQVTGNTLIDQRALDAVLMPMLGVRTLEELQRAAAAVQALYADEGYGAVVAYLPPQGGQGGIVTIAVVEGKIGTVEIRGNRLFSDADVRASLPALQEGTTPRVRLLDAQLRIANENPARHAQVLIKPGQRGGEADVEVAVTEQPLQRVNVGFDNTGNDSTGDYRVSVGWQHASLSGHDDVASAQLQTSPSDPGQVRVVSGAYRWPLYGARVVLDAFAAWSDIDGGTTPTFAGDLSFNGRGRIFGVRSAWYLPRRGDYDQRVALGLDRRDYLNRCDIGGLPSGACGPAGESVTVTPLSLEWLVQAAAPWPMSLGVQLLANLGLGGSHAEASNFDAARPGARPHYLALRWNASALYPVSDDWQLRARFTGQLSPDALVSGEQFGVGGASSVRGYEEREVVGDRGVLLSLELGGPNLLGAGVAPAEGSLRPLAFVDAGIVANQGDTPCVDVKTRCSLSSVGVGARYAAGALQARLDLAYPMKAAARTQRGDTRAHVAITYVF